MAPLVASAGMELRVGCAMWAYKAWQGRQLPERLTTRRAAAGLRHVVQRRRGQHDVLRPAVGVDRRGVGRAGAAGLPVPVQAAAHDHPRATAAGRRRRGARSSSSCSHPLGERAERRCRSSCRPRSVRPTSAPWRRSSAASRRSTRDGHRFAVEVRHPAFFESARSPATTLQRILADEGVEWITLDSTTLFAAPPTTETERETWATQAAPAGPSRGGLRPSRSCGSSAATTRRRRSPAGSRGSPSWPAGCTRVARRRSSSTRPTTSTPSCSPACSTSRCARSCPTLDPLPVPTEVAPADAVLTSVERRASWADDAGLARARRPRRPCSRSRRARRRCRRRAPAPGRAGGCRRR